MEDAVASWLVRSSSDQSVCGQGDIVLCTWVGNFILTVPLSIQVCKWAQANLMLGLTLR